MPTATLHEINLPRAVLPLQRDPQLVVDSLTCESDQDGRLLASNRRLRQAEVVLPALIKVLSIKEQVGVYFGIHLLLE